MLAFAQLSSDVSHLGGAVFGFPLCLTGLLLQDTVQFRSIRRRFPMLLSASFDSIKFALGSTFHYVDSGRYLMAQLLLHALKQLR